MLDRFDGDHYLSFRITATAIVLFMNQDPCLVTSFGHHPNPVRAILSKFTDEKTKAQEIKVTQLGSGNISFFICKAS